MNIIKGGREKSCWNYENLLKITIFLRQNLELKKDHIFSVILLKMYHFFSFFIGKGKEIQRENKWVHNEHLYCIFYWTVFKFDRKVGLIVEPKAFGLTPHVPIQQTRTIKFMSRFAIPKSETKLSLSHLKIVFRFAPCLEKIWKKTWALVK